MENNIMENKMRTSSTILEPLKWRSAIKKFDRSKKVSASDVDILTQAANLAPSSGGVQPFRLIVVENPELKARLQAASYGQAQVADSSHLFVFATQTQIDEELIGKYVQRVAEVRNLEIEGLANLRQALNGSIAAYPAEYKPNWAARQAYISLGIVIQVAASMQIDTCPMEGFDPQQYVEILGLESEGLAPVVILAVGYRGADDPFANAPKVRKAENDFLMRFD